MLREPILHLLHRQQAVNPRRRLDAPVLRELLQEIRPLTRGTDRLRPNRRPQEPLYIAHKPLEHLKERRLPPLLPQERHLQQQLMWLLLSQRRPLEQMQQLPQGLTRHRLGPQLPEPRRKPLQLRKQPFKEEMGIQSLEHKDLLRYLLLLHLILKNLIQDPLLQ